MKPRQLPWKWLLIGLLAILVAGIVLIPRQIGSSPQLRDKIAAALSAWTGGTITMTEPLRIRYFPPVSLRGGFALSGATKLPGVEAITAPTAEISLEFPELLFGTVKIDAVRLGKPVITLKSPDAAEPALHTIAGALVDPPIGAVRIRGGTIKFVGGTPVVKELDVRLRPKGRHGALTAMGSLQYRGETVAFSVDSGNVKEASRGEKAAVTLKVSTDTANARFKGDIRAADKHQALKAEGNMKAEIADVRHVLNWLGIAMPAGESLRGLIASGAIHWNGTTLTFDDGTFSLDGNEAVGLIAFSAEERPRIEGTLDFERFVLDPYLGTGTNPAPDGKLFDWVIFKHLDADLRLSAAEITASTLELGSGGVTLTAKGGTISSEIGALELCGGQATGRVTLDLSERRTEASLAGDVSDVAVETCLAPLELGVPITGTGTLKIDVSTGGVTKEELIRGLVGKFEVAAAKGVVPIDFPAVATGEGMSGWSHDTVTAFDTLNADCRLSAGHVWCQSFALQTPQSTIKGAGSVDVGQQTVDWDLSIANPVAPLNASQLVMEMPPRVTIRGPLTQPRLLGAPGGQGSPASPPSAESSAN